VPALRTAGTLANRGSVRPVADPSFVRASRQRDQAAALAAHDELRSSLATGGPVRLSTFACLPAAMFAELLSLLAVGLDAPVGSAGSRRALSADGRVEVVLRDPADGRLARLVTDGGVLHGPDLLVSIELDGAATGGREEAAGG
ncbi:MAG TPA: DUF2397 family protein, partial [Acidimicrobiales bacterium]|nr:DUF2397 family protein [Acidimicrobiales bacterium]